MCKINEQNCCGDISQNAKATNIECADDKRLRNYNRFNMANIGLEFR